MNDWVGPDINVVGPLEIPSSDEFSITESSHLFGKPSTITQLCYELTANIKMLIFTMKMLIRRLFLADMISIIDLSQSRAVDDGFDLCGD